MSSVGALVEKEDSMSVAEEYAAALADLTVNNKPLINMLTMLAEDYLQHAPTIVKVIESHLLSSPEPIKMPILYLIDSIVKNVKRSYVQLFTQNLVSTFCTVYEKVDEMTKSNMLKLRQTWGDVFPPKKLSALDNRVITKCSHWPLTVSPSNIHINPKFIKPSPHASPTLPVGESSASAIREELMKKQKELLELKRVQLELIQTRATNLTLQQSLAQVGGASKLLPVSNRALDSVEPPPCSHLPLGEDRQNKSQVELSQERPITPTLPFEGQSRKGRSHKPHYSTRDPRLRSHNKFLSKKELHFKEVVDLTQESELSNCPAITVYSAYSPCSPNNEMDKKKMTQPSIEKTFDSKSTNHAIKQENCSVAGTSTPSACDKFIDNLDMIKRSELAGSGKRKHSVRDAIGKKKRTKKILGAEENHEPFSCSYDNSITLPKSPTDPKESTESSCSLNLARSKKLSINATTDGFDEAQPKKPHPFGIQAVQGGIIKELFGDEDVDLRSSTEQLAYRDSLVKPILNKEQKLNTAAAEVMIVEESCPTQDCLNIDAVRWMKKRNPQNRLCYNQYSERDRKGTEPNITESKIEDLMLEGVDKIIPSFIKEDNPPKLNEWPITDTCVAAEEEESTDHQVSLKTESREQVGENKSNNLFGNEDVDLRQMPQCGVLEDINSSPPSTVSNKTLCWPFFENTDRNHAIENQSPSVVANKVVKPQESKRHDTHLGNNVTPMTSSLLDEEEQCIELIHMDETQLSNVPPPSPLLIQSFSPPLELSVPSEVFSSTPPSLKLHSSFYGIGWSSSLDTTVNIKHMEIEGHPLVEEFCIEKKKGMHRSCYDGVERKEPWGVDGVLPDFQGRAAPTTSWPSFLTVPPPVILPPILPPPVQPLRTDLPPPPIWTLPYGCTLPPHSTSSYPLQVGNQVPIPVPHSSFYIPPLDPTLLEFVEPFQTLKVGGREKNVRFYGETAIIMMSPDDPRELTFQNGSRNVVIDETVVWTLDFNVPYIEKWLYGIKLHVRLGSPTRELFIDGNYYEGIFGGQPFRALIGGVVRSIRLDGPKPIVRVGRTRRSDLVVGEIVLTVNGREDFTIFLDGTIQKFYLNEIPCVLRFFDALKSVLINERPIELKFNEIIVVQLNKKNYFIKFHRLNGPSLDNIRISNLNCRPFFPYSHQFSKKPSKLGNLNNPGMFNGKHHFSFTLINDEGVDILHNFPDKEPASMRTISVESLDSHRFFHSEREGGSEDIVKQTEQKHSNQTPENPSGMGQIKGSSNSHDISISLTSVNVGELYKKLVAIGILPPIEPPPDKKGIIPVDFSQPSSLKIRQTVLINQLYSGVQCSSCGVRFTPEETVKYRQHLDWHFRQNRKERNSSKIAVSRRWYYSISDWTNFNEIEDIDTRELSWFELQERSSSPKDIEGEREVAMVPTKLVPDGTSCFICNDSFEQDYSEEKEEWVLKPAMLIDGKVCHPVCCGDYKDGDIEPVPSTVDLCNRNLVIGDEVDSPVETDQPELIDPKNITTLDASSDDDLIHIEIIEPPIESIVIADDDDDEIPEEGQVEELLDSDSEISNSLDYLNVTIKKEKVDVDPAFKPVTTTIDGDMEFTTQPTITKKIKINIKSHIGKKGTAQPEAAQVEALVCDSTLPTFDLVEPASVKSKICRAKLRTLTPKKCGKELSGLCSLM